MLRELHSHSDSESKQATTVRHLRQALLWPLRLIPAGVSEDDVRRRAPWQVLREMGDASPWREHFDEYNGAAGGFHERHYNEFVSFLPYVQRFLYGEGRTQRGSNDPTTGSPMRVFRRRDIAAVRVVPRPGEDPVTLQVVHVDLYFFYGVDIVLLNVEVAAEDLSLSLAQELMYRFGRAYPAGWDANGQAVHCLADVEWLPAAMRSSAMPSWRTWPSTARRASRATGNTCLRPWSITTERRPGLCAIARSSTTACR